MRSEGVSLGVNIQGVLGPPGDWQSSAAMHKCMVKLFNNNISCTFVVIEVPCGRYRRLKAFTENTPKTKQTPINIL